MFHIYHKLWEQVHCSYILVFLHKLNRATN